MPQPCARVEKMIGGRTILQIGRPLKFYIHQKTQRRTRLDGAEWIRTCAIITGLPNELAAPIHDRMPVILPREAWARWLGEEAADRGELQSLLKPHPAERMNAYSISTRVNSVKNDDAGLIEPMMATGGIAV
jgi:putative SOS response-associated peptidase YedK